MKLLTDLLTDNQAVTVPVELASNHLIGFLYAPHDVQFVHARDPVLRYWAGRRSAPAGKGTGPLLQCLVTGRIGIAASKHPLVKKVPGGSQSGIAFVSFNEEAFESYGLTKFENAPVSPEAAEAYREALKRLFDVDYPDPLEQSPMPKRHCRLSANSIVVFWSKGDAGLVDLFADAVDSGNPDSIRTIYESAWKGTPIHLDEDDLSPFYALTLSGAQGRGTVRGWHETTLGAVLRNLRQYYHDLEIVRRPDDEGKPRPLLVLLRQLAVQGDLENIAPNLAAEVVTAILAGRPFPRAVLDCAVRRSFRADDLRRPSFTDQRIP